MSEHFYVVIRSSERVSGLNSNDCTIKIDAPIFDNIEKIYCEVETFNLDYDENNLPDSKYCELQSPDLNIIGQYTQSKKLITTYNFLGDKHGRNSFYLSNFSQQIINFRLVTSTGSLLKQGADNFNYNWMVLLKCTPM